MWDLIVPVPDHCLSFYFEHILQRWGLLSETDQVYDLVVWAG